MKQNKTRASDSMEDVRLGEKEHRELVDRLNRSNKTLRQHEKRLSEIMAEKKRNPDKAELIVEALIEEKKVVDLYSDNLVAAVGVGNMMISKDIKARMMPHLKRYNALVSEYFDKTGGRLTEASYSIPDDIIAGREYDVLPSLSYSRTSANDEADESAEKSYAVGAISLREFKKHISESDSAMKPVRENLRAAKAEMKKAEPQAKAILIVKSLGYQKAIIDSNVELCHAAMNTRDAEEIYRAKFRLECDVNEYNALVDQYEELTGDSLTKASQTLPADVVAGRDYQVLPTITYTVNDPTEDGMPESDYDNANKNVKNKAKQKAQIMDAALEAKIAEQQEKDIKVIEHSANMRKRLIESERDAKCYRFGMNAKDAKKLRRDYNSSIDDINTECNAARRFENMDNERYYTVVRINPDQMRYPSRKADPAKLREIRSEVISLLNRRDEINSKLVALYAGTEITSDGKAVDKRWTEIKKDASERIMKRDRKQAKTIDKLPASRREKQYLYDMMNKKLDAETTAALLEDRLRHGKKLSRAEKKQIKNDIKTQYRNVEYWSAELNDKCSELQRRADLDKRSGYVEPV